VFDGVRDVGLLPIDTCFVERAVEELSCWSHERVASAVFLVTGLFANEHDARRSSSFPENRLRRVRVERTTPAVLHGLRECRERQTLGKKGLSAHRRPQPAARADAGSAAEQVRWRRFFKEVALLIAYLSQSLLKYAKTSPCFAQRSSRPAHSVSSECE